MQRVLTAVVLIPIVLILVLRAPVWLLAAAVAAVSILGLREYVALAGAHSPQPFCRMLYAAAVAALALVAAQSGSNYLQATSQMAFAIAVAAVGLAFLFLALGMRREPLSSGLPAAAGSILGFLYVVTPLAMLVQLREQSSGAFFLLYVLLVVWIGDTAAYYIGRAIGRHKLAPRISPGKTWEGAAANLAGAVITGTLVFAYAREISSGLMSAGLLTRDQAFLPPQPPALWTFALLSAAINVAAQFGDLAESLLKRGAGVKDSGTLLPGHGDMLDRIDALLFAAPVLWYYAAWRTLG